MTTQLLFLPTIAFASGVFAPGAKARFFLSGTSTPVTVYTDTDFLVPAASPLVADAAGRFVQIFYNGTSEVRCVITAADDTAIADIDPVGRSNSTGSAADELSFTPITGNPATDVQAAIAANTAAIQTKAPLVSDGSPLEIVNTNDLEVAIPAGMNKVDIYLHQMSCSTSVATLRGYLGIGGAAVLSPYVGATKYVTPSGVLDYPATTDGFYLGQVSSTGLYNTTINLRRLGSTNDWMVEISAYASVGNGGDTNVSWFGNASISLAGDLNYFLFDSSRIPVSGTYYATWSK